MRGIMWFREDLRVHDNLALSEAVQMCQDGILGIFIIDQNFWARHNMAARRIAFLMQGLESLKKDLIKKNIALCIVHVKKTKDISARLLKIALQIKASYIFYNVQYEYDEKKRDTEVNNLLIKNKITPRMYDDQAILPPGSVCTPQGESYKKFTPFKNAWLKAFTVNPVTTRYISCAKTFLPSEAGIKSKSVLDNSFYRRDDYWLSGERQARKRLRKFLQEKILNYKIARNFPVLNATSQLSPYLASGMISPRECLLAALKMNNYELDTGNPGVITWINELIWRDFYKHLLNFFPRLSMNKPFQAHTEKILWLTNKEHIERWQSGQTGFPIIDAGMRQLNSLGWMHNRLRMIVAMFFTKNLFLDWRLGEEYFTRHLIDADMAANNGGWQWCASTGTDAAPYFRIFNPITQSKRYDPEGKFIKKYCPELACVPTAFIHAPSLGKVKLQQVNYPSPMIDLTISRTRVLAAFKKIKIAH